MKLEQSKPLLYRHLLPIILVQFQYSRNIYKVLEIYHTKVVCTYAMVCTKKVTYIYEGRVFAFFSGILELGPMNAGISTFIQFQNVKITGTSSRKKWNKWNQLRECRYISFCAVPKSGTGLHFWNWNKKKVAPCFRVLPLYGYCAVLSSKASRSGKQIQLYGLFLSNTVLPLASRIRS